MYAKPVFFHVSLMRNLWSFFIPSIRFETWGSVCGRHDVRCWDALWHWASWPKGQSQSKPAVPKVGNLRPVWAVFFPTVVQKPIFSGLGWAWNWNCKGKFMQVYWVGVFMSKRKTHKHTYTWNPNDPCFDWKRPCFGGLTFENRGHLGSRYIYTHTHWCPWILC